MLRGVSNPHALRGFTLVELMIVVVIVAVLAAVAAPAMRSFIANQRVKTASFDLYSTLLFARSEAIKRGGGAGTIRISPSAASNWEDGWTVSFVPASGTAVVLRRQDAVQNITIRANPDNANLDFSANGRPDAAITFTLDSTHLSGIAGRCVSASASGSLNTKVKPGGGC